jgi:hypothetical protein
MMDGKARQGATYGSFATLDATMRDSFFRKTMGKGKVCRHLRPHDFPRLKNCIKTND